MRPRIGRPLDQAPPSSRECDDVVELPVEKATALTNRRRLAILRALLTRRMMVSELEKVLGIKKQMLHEHARVLEAHGFVRSIRSPNRKPVYYELTPIGRRVAAQERPLLRLIVTAVGLLTAGVASLVGSIWLGAKWVFPENAPREGGFLIVTALIGIASVLLASGALVLLKWWIQKRTARVSHAR